MRRILLKQAQEPVFKRTVRLGNLICPQFFRRMVRTKAVKPVFIAPPGNLPEQFADLQMISHQHKTGAQLQILMMIKIFKRRIIVPANIHHPHLRIAQLFRQRFPPFDAELLFRKAGQNQAYGKKFIKMSAAGVGNDQIFHLV